MNKPPAFQFYPSDFMGGSILFNLEQRGLYITLLCLQWDHGFVTPEEWQSLSTAMAQPMAKHVLAKFYKGDDGMFRNLRMEQERVKQATYRANRSKSGKAGAESRWHSHSFANSKRMANDSSPSPSQSSIVHTHTSEVAECPDASIPSWPKVKAMAEMRSVPEASAKAFFDHHQDNNLWVNQYGRLIDWPSKLVSWSVKDRAKETPKQTRTGPTLAEVQAYAKEKWGDDPRHTNWATSFFSYWNAREWKVSKALSVAIDWKIKLGEQVAKWRTCDERE